MTYSVDRIDHRISDIEKGVFTNEHTEQVRRLARDEIETEANERLSDEERAQVIEDKFSDAVSAAVREVKEREVRKKSVLIFGVPMCESSSLKAKIDHDRKYYNTLCSKGLGIKTSNAPRKIARLGKKEDKDRSMKVIFDSSYAVSQ